VNAREEGWQAGRRFRVIREGARLSGMVPMDIPNALQSWGRPLEVGEIIESRGFIMGWGSDSLPEVNFTAADVPDNARHVHLYPSAGMWMPWPADGYLEEVVDD